MPDQEVLCPETSDLRNCDALYKDCQPTQLIREAHPSSIAAGFKALTLAIAFQVVRVFVPPFFLTVSTLLAIPGVGCELPAMVVSAPPSLALDGTARTLFRVVEVRAEFLLAVDAGLLSHGVC